MKWKCVSSVFELMKWNSQFSVTSRPSVPTYPIYPSQSRACGLLSETLEGRRPSITDIQRRWSMRCLKVASFDIFATQSVIWAGGTGISHALSWKYSTSVPTQILQDYRTPRKFTSRFKSKSPGRAQSLSPRAECCSHWRGSLRLSRQDGSHHQHKEAASLGEPCTVDSNM